MTIRQERSPRCGATRRCLEWACTHCLGWRVILLGCAQECHAAAPKPPTVKLRLLKNGQQQTSDSSSDTPGRLRRPTAACTSSMAPPACLAFCACAPTTLRVDVLSRLTQLQLKGWPNARNSTRGGVGKARASRCRARAQEGSAQSDNDLIIKRIWPQNSSEVGTAHWHSLYKSQSHAQT